MLQKLLWLTILGVLSFNSAFSEDLTVSDVKALLIGEWEWIKSSGGLAGISTYADSVDYTKSARFYEKDGSLWLENFKDGATESDKEMIITYAKSMNGQMMWTVQNSEEDIVIPYSISIFNKNYISLNEEVADGFEHSYIRKGTLNPLHVNRTIEITGDCIKDNTKEIEHAEVTASLNNRRLAINGTLELNCCSQKNLNIYKEGNVITIQPVESVEDQCKCLCQYPYSFTMDVDPMNVYTINLVKPDSETTEYTVFQQGSTCKECSDWIRFPKISITKTDEEVPFSALFNPSTGTFDIEFTAKQYVGYDSSIFQYKLTERRRLIIEALTQPENKLPSETDAYELILVKESIPLEGAGGYHVEFFNPPFVRSYRYFEWDGFIEKSVGIKSECQDYDSTPEDHTFEYKVENEVFTFESELLLQCCAEAELIHKTYKDTVKISVKDYAKEQCDCECVFPASFTLENYKYEKPVVIFDNNVVSPKCPKPTNKFAFVCHGEDNYIAGDEQAWFISNLSGEKLDYQMPYNTIPAGIYNVDAIEYCIDQGESDTATFKMFVYDCNKSPELVELIISEDRKTLLLKVNKPVLELLEGFAESIDIEWAIKARTKTNIVSAQVKEDDLFTIEITLDTEVPEDATVLLSYTGNTIKLANGETMDDKTYSINNTTVGITENKTNFEVSPNPIIDIATIAIPKEIKSFTVYTIIGKPVISGEIGSDKKVDLATLTTGLYILEVIGTDGAKYQSTITKK